MTRAVRQIHFCEAVRSGGQIGVEHFKDTVGLSPLGSIEDDYTNGWNSRSTCESRHLCINPLLIAYNFFLSEQRFVYLVDSAGVAVSNIFSGAEGEMGNGEGGRKGPQLVSEQE
jgi:hypothetical protein